jgi:hypothetical protein
MLGQLNEIEEKLWRQTHSPEPRIATDVSTLESNFSAGKQTKNPNQI